MNKICYFCKAVGKFKKYKDTWICECGKIEGELYCPLTFDNCRICNLRIIIATGEQEHFIKNGYCSLRCAGEETYDICR